MVTNRYDTHLEEDLDLNFNRQTIESGDGYDGITKTNPHQMQLLEQRRPIAKEIMTLCPVRRLYS